MATLTPGVLLKLLQSMNTDAKVGGEHRSAVLQVTGIVPALSGTDLWPSQGFYVQLSDSANSTYVSLPDAEADVFLSARTQLGQFVHVDRLLFDSSSSVPRASGLRPVPGASRNPHPFLGRPEPLVARFVDPSRNGFLIETAPSDQPPPPPPPAAQPRVADTHGEGQPRPIASRTVFTARENAAAKAKSDQSASAGVTKRRFSSPGAVKLASRKAAVSATSAEIRDPPAPAPKASLSRPSSPALARSNSRPSSPVPSKCEVPGLVAAKEENRRSSREPAIVVPSRYRQPSPVGGRKSASSPAGRRGSTSSPGRRLSGVFKLSPMAAADGGGKKKMASVIAGISKVSDALLTSGGSGGSSKPGRKSWDDGSPASSVASADQKEKPSSKNKPDKQAILRTQALLSRRLSDVNARKFSQEDISPIKPPTSGKDTKNERKSPPTEKAAVALPISKITVHERKWTDGSVPLDTVSENLAKLGKEALQRRNIAFTGAAEALEEAAATESVIRSLSKFSDLCSSSKPWNPLPAIDRFLTIYEDVVGVSALVGSLCARRGSPTDATAAPGPVDEPLSIQRYKSISLWLEAALATDLEAVSLLGGVSTNGGARLSKHKNLGDNNYVSGVTSDLAVPKGSPQEKLAPGKRKSVAPSTRWASNSSSCGLTWARGYGVKETADLARTIRGEMQSWFLRFVEDALDAGFQLLGVGNGKNSCGMQQQQDGGFAGGSSGSGRITAVLSHLKRVNEWLDAVGKKGGAEPPLEGVERLKRKIYGFVICHVGSAFDSSVTISSN